MRLKRYYNEKLGCSINLSGGNDLTFVLENNLIPIETKKLKQSGMREIETPEDYGNAKIRGLFIHYKDHVNFTGTLDEFGYVSEKFYPVK